MTQARSLLVTPGKAGHFHCVSRCVRRAWLCGRDPLTGRSFEHRKAIVERRILALGNVFAVGIYSYAVMSNHLHVVLSVLPDRARDWSNAEVAERWLTLYPASDEATQDLRRAALLADTAALQVRRSRLCDLSWFMAKLNEYLAKRFNVEDKCAGRFWESRFKCQALLNEKALLAAMAYVDLNPIRAGIASNVATSKHTSVRRRYQAVDKDQSKAVLPVAPIAGYAAATFPKISAVEYIALVDWTGRQWHPTKHGKIKLEEPTALRRLGLDATHWTHKVRGVGNAYWRVIGTVEEVLAKAKELEQNWVHGIRYARWLEQTAS